MFETKTLTFADAKLDDAAGPGRLSGYASVWNGVDSYGDTIVRGAYKSTIADFLRDGFIPWGHDWAGYPVATPDKAREDEHGLWIEAEFHTDPESQRARQIVAERLARGKSMGLSIGYQAKGFDFQEVDGHQVRRLLDIELMEVSLVMVPADASAQVAAVKAKRRLSRHQLEAVIATLQALMGDDDEADVAEALVDGEDAKAADLNVTRFAHPSAENVSQVAHADQDMADALKAADIEPPALDLAGAKLLSDLGAYVARLKAAPPEEIVAERAQMTGLLRQLGTSRLDLDALLKRAEDMSTTDPRELMSTFERINGLYGPSHSRQAG